VEWLPSGMARGFEAHLRYRESPGAPEKEYDLEVNHPLKIGATELFLIGHGYAPVITVRDGEGNVAYSGPTVFLPQGQSFLSFGVVKAPDARPQQIGLEGLFFPTFVMDENGDPANLIGDDINPLLSLNVYTGDLGLDAGASQSVYVLDKSTATPVPGEAGQPLRIDLAPGDTVTLPDGLGSVTFEEVVPWQRIQISQTPGKWIALSGVVLALLGLLGSLFIRSRRVWVRAAPGASGTQVEIATLDRSGGGDATAVVSDLVSALQQAPGERSP
jgi:cytochrome c biogenesis protein